MQGMEPPGMHSRATQMPSFVEARTATRATQMPSIAQTLAANTRGTQFPSIVERGSGVVMMAAASAVAADAAAASTTVSAAHAPPALVPVRAPATSESSTSSSDDEQLVRTASARAAVTSKTFQHTSHRSQHSSTTASTSTSLTASAETARSRSATAAHGQAAKPAAASSIAVATAAAVAARTTHERMLRARSGHRDHSSSEDGAADQRIATHMRSHRLWQQRQSVATTSARTAQAVSTSLADAFSAAAKYAPRADALDSDAGASGAEEQVVLGDFPHGNVATPVITVQAARQASHAAAQARSPSPPSHLRTHRLWRQRRSSASPGAHAEQQVSGALADALGAAAKYASRATGHGEVEGRGRRAQQIQDGSSSSNEEGGRHALVVPRGRVIAARAAAASHASDVGSVNPDTARQHSPDPGLQSHRLWRQRASAASPSARTGRRLDDALGAAFGAAAKYVVHGTDGQEGVEGSEMSESEYEEVSGDEAAMAAAASGESAAAGRSVAPAHTEAPRSTRQPASTRAPAATRAKVPAGDSNAGVMDVLARVRAHRLWRQRESGASPQRRAERRVRDALGGWVQQLPPRTAGESGARTATESVADGDDSNQLGGPASDGATDDEQPAIGQKHAPGASRQVSVAVQRSSHAQHASLAGMVRGSGRQLEQSSGRDGAGSQGGTQQQLQGGMQPAGSTR